MNGDTPTQPDGGNWQFKPSDNQPPKAPVQQPVQSATDSQDTHAAAQDAANWLVDPAFHGDDAEQVAPHPEASWTASEFIAHDKGFRWFLALAASTVVLVLLAYFVFNDVVAVVAIILIAIIFGMMATHKPRVLNYHIGSDGITIGNRTYSYAEFKAFGVIKEDAFSNITLVPTGRFAPMLSIYYPPDQEEHIVDVMSQYLPFAPVSYDGLDKFLRRIHF